MADNDCPSRRHLYVSCEGTPSQTPAAATTAAAAVGRDMATVHAHLFLAHMQSGGKAPRRWVLAAAAAAAAVRYTLDSKPSGEDGMKREIPGYHDCCRTILALAVGWPVPNECEKSVLYCAKSVNCCEMLNTRAVGVLVAADVAAAVVAVVVVVEECQSRVVQERASSPLVDNDTHLGDETSGADAVKRIHECPPMEAAVMVRRGHDVVDAAAVAAAAAAQTFPSHLAH